jgi:primosomal protein N' (replication factor Y)
MPIYCEVALPVPLDRTFTYAVKLGDEPQRGARVIVPFRNEKLVGVVTGLHSNAPVDFEAKPVESVLDEEPILSDDLLELAAWMAQYYLAPLGEVLRTMLPLTAEVRRTVYYRIADAGQDALAAAHDGSPQTARKNRKNMLSAEEHDIEHKVLERLIEGEAVKLSTLRTATAASMPLLVGMLRKKWIVRETSAVERDARRMDRFAVLVPEARLPTLTPKQQAVLAELAAAGNELPLAALQRAGTSPSSLQTLVKRGLVRIEERAASFSLSGIGHVNPHHALNEPQLEAIASFTTAIVVFYLFLIYFVL